MKNIIENEGINTMVDEAIAKKNPGFGSGVVALAIAGLTLVAGAGSMLVKKAYDAHKAKVEIRKPDVAIEVEPEVIEAVATEE